MRSATGGSPNNISSLTGPSSHPNDLIIIDEIENLYFYLLLFIYNIIWWKFIEMIVTKTSTNTNLTLVLTHWNDNEVVDEKVAANLLQLILVGKTNNRPTYTVSSSHYLFSYIWSNKYHHRPTWTMYMSHSQMLGKFEYTLPAKFWRLVGCTEMLSW